MESTETGCSLCAQFLLGSVSNCSPQICSHRDTGIVWQGEKIDRRERERESERELGKRKGDWKQEGRSEESRGRKEVKTRNRKVMVIHNIHVQCATD